MSATRAIRGNMGGDREGVGGVDEERIPSYIPHALAPITDESPPNSGDPLGASLRLIAPYIGAINCHLKVPSSAPPCECYISHASSTRLLILV